MHRAAAILAVTLSSAAFPAQAFIASNDLQVQAQGSGFHVLPKPGSSVRDYWCAAGEYAERTLGMGATDRIWRTSEPPRRSGVGISFGTTPEGAATKTGIFILFGRDDGSLSVGSAQSNCHRL